MVELSTQIVKPDPVAGDGLNLGEVEFMAPEPAVSVPERHMRLAELLRTVLPQLGEVLHWEGLDEEEAARLGVELIEGKAPTRVEAHPTEILKTVTTAEKVLS